MSGGSGGTQKYGDFRRRYRFVETLSQEPESVTVAAAAATVTATAGNECAVCLGQRHPVFRTRFCVTEATLLPDSPRLGEHVVFPVCSKCLVYLYNQRMQAYTSNKRRMHYEARFADLLAWCGEHARETSVLPTLAQFVSLCNAGALFKPALVAHVSALVHQLRTDPAQLTFVRWYAEQQQQQQQQQQRQQRGGASTTFRPSNAVEHLRFRIDATDPPLSSDERTQIEHYVGTAFASY